jgi:uncharacterized protein
VTFPITSALITGASSGLGAAFASVLAERGIALALTAVPAESERLCELAQSLGQTSGCPVATLGIDLTEREAIQRLQQWTADLRVELDLIVNSAGIGGGGAFALAPLDYQLRMIDLNVSALVAVTGQYLPRMVRRHHGGIINVASTAAFDAMPYMAVYAASKAFVLRFGEALWAENQRHGVRVVTLCPGPIATAFHERAGDDGAATGVRAVARRHYLDATAIARSGLRALDQNQPVVTHRLPGMQVNYTAISLLAAIVPARVRLNLAERIARWYFRQDHIIG